MLARLKTRCPACQALISVDDSKFGQLVHCAACQHVFEVSSVEADLRHPVSLETTATHAETLNQSPRGTDDRPIPRRPARHIPPPAFADRNPPASRIGGQLGAQASSSTSPAVSSLAAPTKLGQLGRFKLEKLLGQGAFGRVYLAHDPQLDRHVALKVPTFGPDEAHKIQRFIAEARAAARLRHPNIVPTYESGQAEGQYYIAAQFVAGQPLGVRLKVLAQSKESPKGAPIANSQAADWVRQLAEALAYAHKEGIVHRDIKPDNIMLDQHDVPQIMDFGLAKRLNEDAGMTSDGALLGTPAYMAPEQARGDHKHVGPASDQYALGVVLYQLLTGQKPFEGPPHAVIAQVLSIEPPPPSALRRDIPKDLDAICQKAMSKEIDKRYQDCAALGEDLARWLRGETTAARPIASIERFVRWQRRNPVIARLSLCTLAAVLIAFVAISTAFAWAMSSYRVAIADRNAARQARDHAAILSEQIARERDRLKSTLAELDAQTRAAAKLNQNLNDSQQVAAAATQAASQARQAEQQAAAAASAAVRESESLLARVQSETARAQKLLSQSYLDLGFSKLRDGQVGTGALWLARAYETLPADSKDVALTIRDTLANYLNAETPEAAPAPPLTPSIRLALQHEHPISAACYQPNSSLLLIGDQAGNVQLWNTITGQRLAVATTTTKRVLYLGFNPAEPSSFALLSADTDAVSLWRVTSAPAIERLAGNMRLRIAPTTASWSPDGRWLLAGGQQARSIQLVNPASRQTPAPFGETNMKGGVFAVAYPPSIDASQRPWAAVGTGKLEKALWKWDIIQQKPLTGEPLMFAADVQVLAFDALGKTLAVGAQDKTLTLVESATWAKESGKAIVLDAPATAVAFSPDARLLLVASEDRVARLYDRRERAWVGEPLRHGGPLTAVGFSADGQEFFTAAEDKVLRVWSLPKPRKNLVLELPRPISAVALSPDGGRIVLAADRDLEVRSARSGEVLKQIREKLDPILGLAFDPAGQTFLVADTKNARLWNANAYQPIGLRMAHDQERILALAYSGDGRLVATGGADRQAKVWKAATQELLRPPFSHPADVLSVALDAAGELLLTGCADYKVRLWRLSDDKGPAHELTCNSVPNSVAFSPDGSRIAAGCEFGEVLMWRPDDGDSLGAPLVHAGAVRQIAFFPQSPFLAVLATSDFRIWSLSLTKEVQPSAPLAGSATALAMNRAADVFVATTKGNNSGTLYLWNRVPRVPESKQLLTAFVEAKTGLTLSESGIATPLSPNQLQAAQKSLAESESLAGSVDGQSK